MADEHKPGAGPELPFAVHHIAQLMSDYIGRLGQAWIEGQLLEVRETRSLTYMKLRDTDREEVISIYMQTGSFHDVSPAVEQGSRIVVQAKADWWPKKGSLQFKVLQMRAVGLGELMARIEALRNLLAAEGLFNEDRKKPLPFLPRRVGLVCGQNSDAMFDVIENAKRRWPDVEFVVREVPVQGQSAVKQITTSLSELDAIDDVDVIVIARGGGSFEDLLPFSDESLIRAVAKCVTPVVAAIGHEEDRPLIDYVADYRASTPTDAARKIVPDVVQELADLRNSRTRAKQVISARLALEQQLLNALRERPALSNPAQLIEQRLLDNQTKRETMHSRVTYVLGLQTSIVNGYAATLRALSPQGTLERGFSIVRKAGHVINSVTQVSSGDILQVRTANGEFTVEAN
jgi:exodeoxyribonuclease VII large subunit